MSRYTNIPQVKYDSKRAYRTSRYPEIPFSENDIYVITTAGDRFDLLAQKYYGDSSLWWIISTANRVLKQNSLVPPAGIQIRIPVNPVATVTQFNQVNS